MLLALCLAAGACKDSPTDLLTGVVAGETQPALALGVALPDPSAWWDASNGTSPAVGVLGTWTSSWDLPVERGRVAREASYRSLVAAVPAARLHALTGDELETLRAAIDRARSLPATALPATVRAGLHRAASEAAAAAVARDARDDAGALVHVLRGGDALREVGPEAVARALVDQVEAGLRRIPPREAYSTDDTQRLHRLVEGGREALDRGDWVLAIRRAYYARALLTAH